MRKDDKNDGIIETKGYVVTKRPAIDLNAKLKLWVRSGGRCAICNKYLLDLVYGVNIGEMAHIVGWSTAKGSPRGDAPLEASQRNDVENLVLLCADHHKIVDTRELLEEFTMERLITHKHAHEARILHLTDMKADDDTVVLRMFGGIRGLAVELSREHARQTVFSSERKFALFLNTYDKHGIEIDLSQLLDPDDSWDAYWQMGQKLIDTNLLPLRQGVQKGQVRHLSIFALSRIPLMVYLGYQIGDKIPATIYQKHRGATESWLWLSDASPEEFKCRQILAAESPNTTLILSLSGSINPENVPAEILTGYNVFEIRPVNTTPNRDIFKSRQSGENFAKTYHNFLSQLECSQKDCKQIELVPAIPVAAAIIVGRGIMRHAHPAMCIYDLSGSIYKPSIKINSNETN